MLTDEQRRTAVDDAITSRRSMRAYLPTPVPRGSTLLADFTGATWVGAKPTLVLMDEQGNVLDESKYLFLSNGKLTINTLLGSILFLR